MQLGPYANPFINAMFRRSYWPMSPELFIVMTVQYIVTKLSVVLSTGVICYEIELCISDNSVRIKCYGNKKATRYIDII